MADPSPKRKFYRTTLRHALAPATDERSSGPAPRGEPLRGACPVEERAARSVCDFSDSCSPAATNLIQSCKSSNRICRLRMCLKTFAALIAPEMPTPKPLICALEAEVEVLVLSRGKFERLLGSMNDLQQ